MGCASSTKDNAESKPSSSDGTSQPKTIGDASGPASDDAPVVEQVKDPPAPEPAPDPGMIRTKIVNGMHLKKDKRKYAFAIGGLNVDMQKVLVDDVGIFGFITFSDAISDALKTGLKGAFYGLLKYELMKGQNYSSVFSNVQILLSEQIRTAPEQVGPITVYFVVCDRGGELLIFSSDDRTQMRIVGEEREGGAVEVHVRDIVTAADKSIPLANPLATMTALVKRNFKLSSSTSFLIIYNGLDGIQDSSLEDLFSAGQEYKIKNLADSIYSIVHGSQTVVIVVDLRQTD